MLISLLIGLQAAAGLPEITVKESNGRYRADVVTFRAEQVELVHAEIARRAAALCSGKQIKWGEFGSLAELGKDPGASPPTITGYYQEFRCVVPDQYAHQPAPADWKASAADETDVRRAFHDYYTKRDQGAFQAAIAAFRQTARPESATWPEEMRAFTKKLGPGTRRVVAVTWYVNPPSAEQPGVYAALDFVGDYPAVHFYCGYLVFYRVAPGAYEIAREEQNIFHRSDTDANPDHLAQMRAAACRGD